MNTLAVGREKDRYAVKDKITGKETDAFSVLVSKWTPHPYNRDGLQISQTVLYQLATNPKLTRRALRIALWLISRIEKGRPMHVCRVDMAKELGMHRSDISRGLNELHVLGRVHDENGVIYNPILPPGVKPTLGVRPSVAWKGSSKDLVEAIRKERTDDERLGFGKDDAGQHEASKKPDSPSKNENSQRIHDGELSSQEFYLQSSGG